MITYHPNIHRLKTHPQHFVQVASGLKPFELRKDDRGYAVDDLLILEEWEPEEGEYTGHVICALVLSLLRGDPWLQPGYVAMGIRVLS